MLSGERAELERTSVIRSFCSPRLSAGDAGTGMDSGRDFMTTEPADVDGLPDVLFESMGPSKEVSA